MKKLKGDIYAYKIILVGVLEKVLGVGMRTSSRKRMRGMGGADKKKKKRE